MMFFLQCLEQKISFSLKTHKWLWKAVVNQIGAEVDTINQNARNMVLRPL